MKKELSYVAPLAREHGNALPELAESKPRKNFFLQHLYLIPCMALPAILMYLIYLSKGLYPFGDGCVLVLDLNGQYVWFFEALRNCVNGDASLLYSFSRALGGEFVGIYAYYLASPLSYIVCFFPEDQMLEALLTLFLIKTALCGATFGYYMNQTMRRRNPYAVVLFSICYALTSYAVVQQNNTMWIDAVIWLPLVTLGIERLIKHGSYKLYTVTLALTIFSNYYIGYMVCIYSAVYFFLYYFAHAEKGLNNPHGERAHFVKSLTRMAFFSLLGVGIAAVIILGAYYSLNFGKTTFSNPQWTWTVKTDFLELVYKLLPGSYDTVRPAGYPFVYCGLLTILLVPAYFLTGKDSIRQKIIAGIFIFFFVASFSFTVTDLIWHGFQKPNWLNYRYSFMLCFVLCVLACRAFSEFETVSLKSVAATAGLIGVVCIILQKYNDGAYVDPHDFTCIWFTILMLFVYLCLLGILRVTASKQVVSIALICAISIEVFLNGLWNLNGLDKDVTYSKYSYYNNFLNKTRPIVEMVQESDTSFYRMEKTFFRKVNDNMALNIRGLSGSTSTLNKETIHFLNKMGYASKSHWSKYVGGTPVNDSLLGLKYIISNNTDYGSYYEIYKTDAVNEYTAYYNPYALSLAYGVDDDVLDFVLGFVESMPEDSEDEKKSVIASAIESLKSSINQLLDIDETVNSAEYLDVYDSPFERLNAIVTAMLGEEETVQIFVPIQINRTSTSKLQSNPVVDHTCYTPRDGAENAYVEYRIKMPVDGELFFYAPSDYPREVSLTLREGNEYVKKGTFNGLESTCIITLGQHEANETLALKLTLKDKNFYVMNDQDYFYYIDWAVFEDAMARLAKDQYQITEYTETSFTGTFTASREEELVLTTLAYDEGWKVYVDGVEVEIVKALGSLVSFYIDGDAGETHNVEIIYKPRTHIIGLILSLSSLALLILIMILEKRLKKVPVLRALLGIPQANASLPLPEAPVETQPIPAYKRYRHKYGQANPRKRRKDFNRKD